MRKDANLKVPTTERFQHELLYVYFLWNGNSSKCLTSHKQLFADDEVIVGVSELYDKKSYKLLTRKLKPKMTTFESFLVNKCLRTINIKF